MAVNKVSVGYGSGIGDWSITKVTSEAAYASITSPNVNDGFIAYGPQFKGNVGVNAITVIDSNAWVI